MTSPQFQKRPCRPRDALVDAGRNYPTAWSLSDKFRADRADLPSWPDWCYLPMAGWYAIVSGGGPNRVGMDRIGDVARLAALGAWRVTQGIYRFDPTLYESVYATELKGDLPSQVLFGLPSWCVYVETPGADLDGAPLHGFFAHLECDANSGQHELRLLLDSDGLTPVPIHLGPWSLGESVARAIDVANVRLLGAGSVPYPPVLSKAIRILVEPLVSLLLYLCSQNAEIGDGTARPENPAPRRTKKGWRLFPAERVTTWDVGVRLGAALRRAYHAAETAGDGTHAGPRGHVRNAHWHGFRSGPMKTADGTPIPTAARRFDVRWLPPIPVNLDNIDDLPATIRPVKP